MSEEQQPVQLTKGDFEPEDSETFEWTVMGMDDKPRGTITMRPTSYAVLAHYREILAGLGRRRGDQAKANEYLFRRAFVSFTPIEGAVLSRNGHKSDVDFFCRETPKMVDRVIQAYHARNFTDVQDTQDTKE
jgi:hypothetical protein